MAKEDGTREIELARDNQGKPDVSLMYSAIAIAINLKRIAEQNEMNTRDFFAGMALQGMLAAGAEKTYENRERPVIPTIVANAYYFADAMMKERERK